MEEKIGQRSLILKLLEVIALCELDQEDTDMSNADYINQRTLISSLFNANQPFCKGQVILRLTVIDSLYSTNAAYSYFSIDEMAEKIISLGQDASSPEANLKAVRDYFYNVALTGSDPKGLFSESYGIQKNLSEGSKQMSLMSKYAYYELLQDKETYPLGFPIYDRLAKDAYPTVCKMLGEDHYFSLPSLETPTIEEYIACIQQLRQSIFGNDKGLFLGKYQQYDILDAYLWRMGKIDEGNYSLLMGRKDYTCFITNLGLAAPKGTDKTELEEYNTQLTNMFTQKCHKDKNKYNFNALISAILKEKDAPFKGLDSEKYLTALYAHWKVFDESKSIGPKRGVNYRNYNK